MDDELDPLVTLEIPDTDYDETEDSDDLFELEYDIVYLPDGSIVESTSVLDDPSPT
jgi:hypothetical protein